MTITRYQMLILKQLINRIKSQSFNIQTQYKFLKLNNVLKEEMEIYQTQMQSLTEFFERDENGNFVQLDATTIKIKPDKIEECNVKKCQIYQTEIQLPDFCFSLDELEPLNLTLEELEVLEKFIKD